MKNVEIIESKTSFGSKHQKERYLQKNILRNPFQNMKSTTFERTMKKTFCPFGHAVTSLEGIILLLDSLLQPSRTVGRGTGSGGGTVQGSWL